jgi:CubicO group peptidase (beta-lactamase class C family)
MKKVIILFTSLLFILPSIFSQSAVGETQAKSKKIDALMKHCHEFGMFNGAILVSEKGNIIYRNAFGDANKEKGEKLLPESAFYLASVSKQFTTMAIMMLKERGKLSFSDPLSKYFPAFPDYADKVTIRHLMTHTSGVPDHYRLNLYRTDLKNSDVLERLVKQDTLDFAPGEKYSYSNGGFVMLAMIAEKAADMPFHTFMKENIFDPLGMDHTLVFDESKPKIPNRAIGYNQTGELDDYEILTTGAGGMFSNVDDLYLWDQALYTEKLVSKETLEEAFTPTILNSGDVSDYGYGWGIKIDGDKKVVAHSGSLGGYRSFLRRDLSTRSAHMILSNNGGALAMGPINTAIENILAGEKYELPKIPFASKLRELMQENEASVAAQLAKDFLEAQSDKYDSDEQGVNTLGYDYLGKNEYSKALAVFRLNIDLNPTSANTYDSMGEAYMKSGDTENAIFLYKKSVELNPNNTNGIQMLADMGVNTDDLVPKVEIPTEVLDSYIGKYELQPGFVLTILRDGDKMMIHPTGQSISEIFPSSQTRFYSKVVDAQLTFNVDSDGKVSSLTLHQGGDMVAQRIE